MSDLASSPPDRSPHLSIKEIGDANRRAQLDGKKLTITSLSLFGVAAGTCAGFLSGFLATKGLRLTRNVGLLSGLASGVAVGYIFTQQSLRVQLAKADHANTELRRHLGQQHPPPPADHEGGVGGMEAFHDKYQTTRGDH
ncbi:hypothetical protein JCM11491_005937 [Sporobolomyces phaffii]